MRRQLRPFYTADQLAAVYARSYDHTRWPDHIERVARTAEVLDDFADRTGARVVADLSCGDGAIVQQSQHRWEFALLGDLALPVEPLDWASRWVCGPIEATLPLTGPLGVPPIDVFVLSETLEHVEDPDRLLASIRSKARHLLLTTPNDETDDSNPEHYWGWNIEDLRLMLERAGWTEHYFELFTPQSVPFYTFQIWTCSYREMPA